MLANFTINIILCPTLGQSWLSDSIQPESFQLSFPLGTVEMISILSGVGVAKPRLFSFIYCFQPIVWILILLSYVVFANIASYIEKSWSQIWFFFSSLLNQSESLVLKSIERRYALLMGLWLFMTFFIYYSFHESLLTSILYERPDFMINSVEEMAEFAIDGKLKKFYVVGGEPGEGYINGRNDFVGDSLRPLMEVINIAEDNAMEWEATNLPLFASGEYAMISDNSFLDYKYSTKLAEYPRLYRSRDDTMTLPYFIALSSNVPAKIKKNFDRM